MSYVNLTLAKSHLAVFHNSDDALIQQTIDAAESYAAAFMNRPAIRDHQPSPWIVSNIDAESGSSEVVNAVPPAVIQAILLLVADYYNNREAQIVGSIVQENKAAHALLFTQRIGLGV